jgi:putative hydrolase of the HAD superfamily
MKRAVAFDLWGTLVPFPPAHYRYLAGELADALGIDVDEFAPAWAATFDARATGATIRDALATACASIDREAAPERIAVAERRRVASYRSILQPRPGAAGVIGALRQHGVGIGLVTDSGVEAAEAWPQFALAPQFDAAVFSCREGVTKPNPVLYLKVLELLGVDAVEVLYVGDRSEELHGAAAVGMAPLLFEPGEIEPQEWDGPRITSLPELLDA